MYFVYILANSTDDDLYKGFSEQPFDRLQQHNLGEVQFTATKKEWRIVALFRFATKKEALVFEKRIKRLNRRSLNKLIASPQNIIKEFQQH